MAVILVGFIAKSYLSEILTIAIHFPDEFRLPGRRFSAPMYIMLDLLRHDDLSRRRAGEAWMRCSMKSYLR